MKILNYKNISILICIISMSILFAGIFSALDGESYSNKYITNGSMDLTEWNLTKDDILSLNGDWEFYWQRLLSFEYFYNGKTKPDIMVEVPKVWNSYKLDDKSLPGFGAATYRLAVRNAPEGQNLAIRMPTVSTAYNLFINNWLIASNGQVSISKQHFTPEYRPQMVIFIPPSKDFDIILQVANFSYARGGVWYPIFMGTSESMLKYDKSIGYKDLFLIGAFLIMALYYLCIYYLRKQDKSSLYFVMLCLIALGRTIIYGDYIINKMLLWNGYYLIVAIDYITLIWFPVTFILLIGELFSTYISHKYKKVLVAYAVIMSLFIILSPIYIYTSLTYFIEAMALLIAAYAVICAAKAFPKYKEDSIIVFTGVTSAALGGVHDILYQNNIISSSFGELSPFGFLVFLFLNAFILAKRFSEAFKDAKLLSEKLIRFDKLKDEFLANTSHELRTPLNAIISTADGISRGTEGAVNENQKAALDMITSSGKHLTNLINDILDYSKLKNFNLKMNLEAVNLKRSVESVMNVLGRLNKTAAVQMLIDIPDDIPDIYADENRLLQILHNLIGNALKFTEAGYIKVSAVKAGESVEICIEDTGIGISEERFDIIFESFRQLEASLTKKSGGTGLGLSITKYLVEAQGGKIRVESKVGEGSKFFFSIPVSTEAAKEQALHPDLSEAEGFADPFIESYINKPSWIYKGDGPHIILVDDNKTNLMSLTGILKLADYSVTAVNSSEEFFEKFKAASNVSLVILDVMLPGLSGYDICREIRKDFSVSELPVLMLTARTAAQDIVMGLEAGANDYIAKPFDTDEFLARVNTLIQLKQSVDKVLASELAFLQAQIKPHFLYNALNTFVSISLYDIDKARTLIVEFGNYLRRSFDFRDLSQLAPLKSELELVRAYLEIEKARFEERIEVVYDLPEDLEVRIPILVLQPIVENAVIHGILPKADGGRIEICIKRDEKILHIMVKDNGVGMELGKKDCTTKHEFGSGVGMSNIDGRLRKLYGKGLEINSILGKGTEVAFCVPVNNGEVE